MMLGQRWGFLLALAASVPFWYTAVFFYFWDRDLGFRENDRHVLDRHMGNVAGLRSDRGRVLLRPSARMRTTRSRQT